MNFLGWMAALFLLVAGCGSTGGDGELIAVSSDRDGDWDIVVVDLDRGVAWPLSFNRAFDWGPKWSPDGSRLAFASDFVNGEVQEVLLFDESNLDLGFVDVITMDQVKNSENLKLVKDVVKLICNREMNVTLILSDKAKNLIVNSSNSSSVKGEKKKVNSLNQNRDKSEIEIIQNALDVFGGVVIK